MRALVLLLAGAVLTAPAAASMDWTKKSPIRVTPSWLADREGTIVKMVPGARSGRKAPAAATAPAPRDCGCQPIGESGRAEPLNG
jgi:hypothetical protein